MALDRPTPTQTIPPLGVRLLAYLLMCAGSIGLICVAVAALAMGPAAALTLLVFGGFALGTTVAGAGLSRGYAWPIAWLKALIVLAAVSVVAVFAFAPLLIYIGAVQIGLAGFVLLAPIRYLERPSVRAVLRPPKKDRVRPAMAPLRRLAPTLRSIGGFGLFVWGIGAAAFFGYLWARAAADPPPGLEGLIVFVAPAFILYYALPCIGFGLFIWRGSPGPLALLIGVGLALMSAVQLGPPGYAWPIPAAIAAVLAVGFLAPTGRRRSESQPPVGP